MRRAAVVSIWLGLQLGCTTTLFVPAAFDGGASSSGGNGGISGGSNGGKSGSTGSGGRTGSGTGGSGSGMCNRMKLAWDIYKTELVFSVGRNYSMSTAFGNTTRMAAVQQSVRSLVQANQTIVSFGYQDFPSAASCTNGTACCANTDVVYPTLGTSFMSIDQALRMCDLAASMPGCVSQSNARPIGDALNDALNSPFPIFDFRVDDKRDHTMVLIVDGPPGCSSEDPVSSCDSAKFQVSKLNNAPVKTYVVKVGDDAESSNCLQQIAQYGGAPVYMGKDPGQLMQSLTQIVASAAQAACFITLTAPPSDPSRVSLEIRGQRIQPDNGTMNGWSYVGGSTDRIRVQGPPCTQLQDIEDDRDLVVWYGCPP
jgi:hypothetical protein